MNKKQWRFSASQLQLYQDCPRKYWFNYVKGLKAPAAPSAQLGSEVHDILESLVKLVKSGNDSSVVKEFLERLNETRAGKIAREALPYLPAMEVLKSDTIAAEGDYFLDIGGFSFIAKIDLLDKDTPLITDYKTSSNFKWALKEETLQDNIQAIIYSLVGESLFQTPPALRWLYLLTKGKPKAQPVCAKIKDLADKKEKIIFLAGKCQDAHKADSPHAFMPVTNTCSKYGGCPYKEVCIITPDQHIEGIMSDSTGMSLLEELLNKSAPKTEEAQQADFGKQVESMIDQSTGINPPEESIALEVKEAAEVKAEAAEVKAEAAEVKAEEAPKKKRTRRSKKQIEAEAAAKEAEAAEVKVEETKVEETKEVKVEETKEVKATEAAPKKAPKKQKPKGYTLFIDCLTARGPELQATVQASEDWLRGIEDKVNAYSGVHYRCLDYDKGIKDFTAVLIEEVKAGTYPEGVFISSRITHAIISDILMKNAQAIIKGVF